VGFTLAFALQLRNKQGKTSALQLRNKQGKTSVRVAIRRANPHKPWQGQLVQRYTPIGYLQNNIWKCSAGACSV